MFFVGSCRPFYYRNGHDPNSVASIGRHLVGTVPRGQRCFFQWIGDGDGDECRGRRSGDPHPDGCRPDENAHAWALPAYPYGAVLCRHLRRMLPTGWAARRVGRTRHTISKLSRGCFTPRPAFGHLGDS